jgi:hypothetical protein
MLFPVNKFIQSMYVFNWGRLRAPALENAQPN